MKRVLAVICMIGFVGCYNDKADKLYPSATTGCDTTNVTFKADIQPVLSQYCALSGCHDAASAQFGYDLSGYTGAQLAVTATTSSNIPKLLATIKRDPSEPYAMPNNGIVLDACTVNKIARWINLGAQNN